MVRTDRHVAKAHAGRGSADHAEVVPPPADEAPIGCEGQPVVAPARDLREPRGSGGRRDRTQPVVSPSGDRPVGSQGEATGIARGNRQEPGAGRRV